MSRMSWIAAALVAALLFAASAGAEEAGAWSARLKEKAESVVYLRVVLKVQITMGAQSQEQERSMEAPGVIIDERGLILTSNSYLDPAMQIPPRMRDQIQVKSTPSDIKVVFGNEEEEYPAQIAAIDSLLGLAFVQILDLKERAVKTVDFSAPAPIAVGQEIFGVARLARDYDYAPVLNLAYVRGKVEKPREMWVLGGEGNAPGLPAFDAEGRLLGVVAIQAGSEGVEGGGTRPFLLPAAALERARKAAREKADELLAAAKEAPKVDPAPAEEPKETPAPTEQPTDGGGEK